MKKTNIMDLHEIRSTDIQNLNDYVQEAIQMFSRDILKTTNGVIRGLEVTQHGEDNTIDVSIGAIFYNGDYALLEAPSGQVPVTLHDGVSTVVAEYVDNVEDTPVSGYMIVDVADHVNSLLSGSAVNDGIESLVYSSRKLSAVKISIQTDIYPAGVAAKYIPLAQLDLTTSGITKITDVRKFPAAGTLNEINNQSSYSLPLKANSVPTANQLLALDENANFDLGEHTVVATSGAIENLTSTSGVIENATIENLVVNNTTFSGDNNFVAPILTVNSNDEQSEGHGVDSGIQNHNNTKSFLWHYVTQLATGFWQVVGGALRIGKDTDNQNISIDGANSTINFNNQQNTAISFVGNPITKIFSILRDGSSLIGSDSNGNINVEKDLVSKQTISALTFVEGGSSLITKYANINGNASKPFSASVFTEDGTSLTLKYSLKNHSFTEHNFNNATGFLHLNAGTPSFAALIESDIPLIHHDKMSDWDGMTSGFLTSASSLAYSKITGLPTEMSYLTGVTSSIQTQLSSKLDTSATSGFVTSGYVNTNYLNKTSNDNIPIAATKTITWLGTGNAQISENSHVLQITNDSYEQLRLISSNVTTRSIAFGYDNTWDNGRICSYDTNGSVVKPLRIYSGSGYSYKFDNNNLLIHQNDIELTSLLFAQDYVAAYDHTNVHPIFKASPGNSSFYKSNFDAALTVTDASLISYNNQIKFYQTAVEINTYSNYFDFTKTAGGYANVNCGVLTQNGGGDLAELIPVSDDSITTGDIVVIDPNNDENLIKSTIKYDITSVGIISTEPGNVLSKSQETNTKPVALSGRVPAKVTTKYTNKDGIDVYREIKRGYLLVTSNVEGHLMAADPSDCVNGNIPYGSVIGKAMQGFNPGTMTEGVVTVLVGAAG